MVKKPIKLEQKSKKFSNKFSLKNKIQYFLYSFDPKFRIVISVLLTLTVMIPSWYLFSFVNNYFKPESEPVVPIDKKQETIDFAKQIIEEANINPADIIYEELAFTDLPIYPPAWQESHFGGSQNQNIVGQNADPDNDGLINKLEYIYGSDPLNPDTLCQGLIDNVNCLGRNDKENVDLDISPLTGEVITLPEKIVITDQDEGVLSRIQNNFNKASEEGVDFPTLYQLSKKIDLSQEVSSIQIKLTEENIETLNNYNQLRVDAVDKFIYADDLGGLSQIYASQSKTILAQQKQNYTEIIKSLIAFPVPTRFQEYHQNLILMFQKIEAIIDHRLIGFEGFDTDQEFKDISKNLAVEIVWTYRNFQAIEATL